MVENPASFLDTIGTVLISVLFGPWWGSLTGLLTNAVMGVTTEPSAVFFGLVNVAIAIVTGIIARKFDFKKWYVALSTGFLLSIIAPLIGTPIAVALFGGLNGSGMDLVVLWARSAGESIFASTFISRITGNFVDKILTCLMIMFLLNRIPGVKKIYTQKKDSNHAA
ncbi:ECF transporter S component [Neobacillus sp. PS3-34]|uniref:CD3073 family putative ECF transporter S component n=1 Tax=Neobacillus sp. PS3-34 TaxID=3070678 RepID=UPI0027DEFAAA|nr:CD3073 family putative ECF transporter S component [Neobacillus sp. PS3-34]WML49745.1 ECF transporter S component [Neobacillus sp. PS3-34]